MLENKTRKQAGPLRAESSQSANRQELQKPVRRVPLSERGHGARTAQTYPLDITFSQSDNLLYTPFTRSLLDSLVWPLHSLTEKDQGKGKESAQQGLPLPRHLLVEDITGRHPLR